MKLSIIVPVYNAAPWLARCLDSLLDQGLDASEYEIILINDGSTDGSPCILARYASDHPQIRVFTQENRGQGAARNRGLDLACGEWIGFVDADDYLEENGLIQLLPYCNDTTEGVRFYSRLLAPGSSPGQAPEDKREVSFKGNGREFITAFGLETFCWSWLYSKRFLDKHGIRFLNRKSGEDLAFLYHFLAASPAVVVVPKDIYRYVVHENSLTTCNTRAHCRAWAEDLTSVFSDIRQRSELFRHSAPLLYDRVHDSFALRLPMLFSRIFKADLTIREFKGILSRLKEKQLIPTRVRSTWHPFRLSLCAVNILAACPYTYAPGKWIYTHLFIPFIRPFINRNGRR